MTIAPGASILSAAGRTPTIDPRASLHPGRAWSGESH